MLKFTAWVFGVFFIVIGILGFLPQTAAGGMLFGLFKVNFLHNLIHFTTGVIAISMVNQARLFFCLFGMLYLLVAILGFWYGDHAIFGWLANNYADAILHALIAAFALYMGFGYKRKLRQAE